MDYKVHFSCYHEQYGNFDEFDYTVQADNPFEAREKAWRLCDGDEETKFRSCIKQYAVTWQSSVMNAEDYFRSHAAYINESIRRIDLIDKPNMLINKSDNELYYEQQRLIYLGSLQTLNDVAKDMYGELGMAPPSIFEELHYAEKLCESLGYGDQTDALWERIERAKKWDQGSIYDIRDLFQKGYIYLAGETVLFRDYFGRNGVYPFHQDIDERKYTYTHRWDSLYKYNRLSNLPMLQQDAVIRDSAGNMDYTGYTLVVDINRFHSDYHTPEMVLWQLADNEVDANPNKPEYFVKNAINSNNTGVINNHDILGVLRPDIVARIDFPALRAEYAAAREAAAAQDMEGDYEAEE